MSNDTTDKIKILYEDKHCLVIDKPAGIMVHSDGRTKGPFVTDWILKNYPEAKDIGDPMTDQKGEAIDRSGIVHRLDKETSGVLLVAKTKEGHSNLKKQFHDRAVLKKYLALVWGEIKEEFGTINRPIGRSADDFRKFSAQRGARGDMKEAETYWTKKGGGVVIVDSGGEKRKEKFTLVEVEPKTGRTHQIRVHFSAINHPVVGDTLYAPKKPHVLGFKRLALHARSIQFRDLEGKIIKITSSIPEDFIQSLVELGIESLEAL